MTSVDGTKRTSRARGGVSVVTGQTDMRWASSSAPFSPLADITEHLMLQERTGSAPYQSSLDPLRCCLVSHRGGHEAAGIYRACRRGGGLAGCGAGAAGGSSSDWIPERQVC